MDGTSRPLKSLPTNSALPCSVATGGTETWTPSVVNPPATLAAAQAVAAEHFAVCTDTIFQGVGSIAEYAAALAKSARWTFWWD